VWLTFQIAPPKKILVSSTATSEEKNPGNMTSASHNTQQATRRAQKSLITQPRTCMQQAHKDSFLIQFVDSYYHQIQKIKHRKWF